MYGLEEVTSLKDCLVTKCNSVSGNCIFKQRKTGLAKTISPMEENRMTSILGKINKFNVQYNLNPSQKFLR